MSVQPIADDGNVVVALVMPARDRVYELVDAIVELRAGMGVEFEERPDHCRAEAVDALMVLEKLDGWVSAVRNEILVHACGTVPISLSQETKVGDRSVGDIRATEIAAVLNVSANRARNVVHDARILVCELNRTNQMLESGNISEYKSRIVAEGFTQLSTRFKNSKTPMPSDLASRFERRALGRAELQTIGELKRTVAKSVAMLAPVDDATIRAQERLERHVSLQDGPNGMSWLNAYLPSVEASRVYQVLTHSARNDKSLSGSQQARMADALIKIVDGTSEVSPELRNRAAELQVMVSYENLEGVATGNPEARLVGEIASTGLLVEGQELLDLVGDAKFRRLVFDPVTGQLLDFGRTTYQPPANLRDHVTARDVSCRTPGCDRPARYCDVDHIVAYDDGGETKDLNLATLCRTHHLMKTHGEWRYELDDQGRAQWKLPGSISKTKLLDNHFNDLALSAATLATMNGPMYRDGNDRIYDSSTRLGSMAIRDESSNSENAGKDDPPPF